MSHRLRNRPGELSGGQKQRVAIARVMVVATHDDRISALGREIVDLGNHQEQMRA